MKLYKIGFPGESPVLVELEKDGEPLSEIVLGERGRGRTEKTIPIIGDGPEVRAKKSDEGDIVLVRGVYESETRCLAIINATGAYSKGRRYEIHDAVGVMEIAAGIFAFGDAGRCGNGEEVLAIIEPEAEFRLDGKYSSTWYAWMNGSWRVETPEKRQARLALEKVSIGGGEWL